MGEQAAFFKLAGNILQVHKLCKFGNSSPPLFCTIKSTKWKKALLGFPKLFKHCKSMRIQAYTVGDVTKSGWVGIYQ